MKRHISNEVVCPFYRSEDGQRVCCEGVEDNSSIHVVFGTPQNKQRYSLKYCCNRYDDCKVAQMLYDKYEGDEDEQVPCEEDNDRWDCFRL